MRAVAWMLLAGTLAGCNGPTSLSPLPFPDIVGTWIGSRTVDLRIDDGSTRSNVCTEPWMITTQSDGSFTGMAELGGGTSSPCGGQAAVLWVDDHIDRRDPYSVDQVDDGTTAVRGRLAECHRRILGRDNEPQVR